MRRKVDVVELLAETDRSLDLKSARKIASAKVHSATHRGIIVRQKNCVVCGGDKGIEGHHPDLCRPLVILWLCNKCHHDLHNALLTYPVVIDGLSDRELLALGLHNARAW